MRRHNVLRQGWIARWRSRAFTLLEILIVLVILGVIAALAVPAYNISVENSRKQEALKYLELSRQAILAFQQGSGGVAPTAWTQLSYNPTNVAADPVGMVRAFTYSGAPGATIVATRNCAVVACGPGVTASYTGTMTVASGNVVWTWP